MKIAEFKNLKINRTQLFFLLACRTAQKQNVTDGTVDWTCKCDEAITPPVVVVPPVFTPPISNTASCNFGSTTLAYGAVATGYSTVTAPCTSQAVTCTNGVLSNPSFRFDSCAAAPVAGPVVADGCPSRALNVEFTVSKHHQRMVTGGWDNMTSPAIPQIPCFLKFKNRQKLRNLGFYF